MSSGTLAGESEQSLAGSTFSREEFHPVRIYLQSLPQIDSRFRLGIPDADLTLPATICKRCLLKKFTFPGGVGSCK